MITVEDLDAKEEYKQVKITPKFNHLDTVFW